MVLVWMLKGERIGRSSRYPHHASNLLGRASQRSDIQGTENPINQRMILYLVGVSTFTSDQGDDGIYYLGMDCVNLAFWRGKSDMNNEVKTILSNIHGYVVRYLQTGTPYIPLGQIQFTS